jgi:hypothetical protein
MKNNTRVDVRAILAEPAARKRLMVSVIIATQAREGIETTQDQAETAYDIVQRERLEAGHCRN